MPSWDQLTRGLALAGLSLSLTRASFRLVRRWGLLAVPVSALLAVGAVLAAWGGLIQITGGQRHDDHPFL